MTTNVRPLITGAPALMIVDFAERHRLDVTDVTVAAIEEAFTRPIDVANRLGLDSAHVREPLTQAEFKAGLRQITRLCVAGTRLGPVDFDGAQSTPFHRSQSGLDFDDADLGRCWGSTRGHWVISTRAQLLCTFRAGNPRGVFGVRSWSPPAADGRRWALDGYAIVDQRRIDPESRADLGAASSDEAAVATFVFAHRLSMPNGASNPIVYLND